MKDSRKNIKVDPGLHQKILEASTMTGLTMVDYLDSLVSDDLHRLSAMSKRKPVRVK